MVPPEEEGEEFDPTKEYVPPTAGGASDLLDDLAKLDHKLGTVKPADGMSFVPDGKYQVYVKGAKLAKGKQSPHNLMLKLEFTVAGPQHQGRTLFKNLMLVTEDNIAWAKKNLATCGIAVKGSGDIIQATQKLPGMGLNVTVKNVNLGLDGKFITGQSNTNVYIDGVFKGVATQEEMIDGNVESSPA